MTVEPAPHPICAQRQRRLRVAAICLAIDLAVLLGAHHFGAAVLEKVAGVALVLSGLAALRFAFLLHFRCPGQE